MTKNKSILKNNKQPPKNQIKAKPKKYQKKPHKNQHRNIPAIF